MEKKITLLFVLALFVSPLFALNFTADYIDGFLDVKDGSAWNEVYIGDSLPSDAVVRLENDSYAELSFGSEVIKLSRSGIYELQKLLGAKKEVAESGMNSLFSGKFKTLLKENNGKTQTTVGGVRAAEAETVTIDWMSSETADLIADGRKALEGSDFDGAYELFAEAYDYSADSYEESEALYFLGLTSAMKGDYAGALASLDSADVEKDSEYYTDFYLLKGQLLVESYANEEAFSFLGKYDTSTGQKTPDKLQEIYFLIAVSGNNTGNSGAAVTAINKLVNIDPASETAKAALAYKSRI